MDDDLVWSALGNATRRDILDLLRHRPKTTSEVAAHIPLSRYAVMQHLAVLEAANLIVVRRAGRSRWNQINPIPIHEVARRWLRGYELDAVTSLLRVRGMAERPGAKRIPGPTQGARAMSRVMDPQAPQAPQAPQRPAVDATTGVAGREIVFQLWIRATPETVWRLLTDPAEIPRWSYPYAVEIDRLAPGGRMRFVCAEGEDDEAEVLAAEPNRRLAYRWRSSEPEPTEVEVILEPRADYTRLVFRNAGFLEGEAWDHFYEANYSGWLEHHLALKRLAEAGA